MGEKIKTAILALIPAESQIALDRHVEQLQKAWVLQVAADIENDSLQLNAKIRIAMDRIVAQAVLAESEWYNNYMFGPSTKLGIERLHEASERLARNRAAVENEAVND